MIDRTRAPYALANPDDCAVVGPTRCPNCGRFVGNVTYSMDSLEERVHDIRGDCSRCGEVTPIGWSVYP
jgi:uncharacterized protein with PIN domain